MEPKVQQAMLQLLQGLPQVMFCIKEPEGRYVAVNQAFAERVARWSPAEVVGARADDVFPPALAWSYEAQDRELLATGRALVGHLELVLRPDGSPGWYLTNKVLLGSPGTPDARILSVSVDLEAVTPGGRLVESLRPIVDVIHARFADPLRVEDLAAVGGLTSAQLERRMRRVFGVSVKQYHLRKRLEEAVALLLGSDRSIGEIAGRCGYTDQSALTRHLRRVMGVTPGQLRTGRGEPPSRSSK